MKWIALACFIGFIDRVTMATLDDKPTSLPDGLILYLVMTMLLFLVGSFLFAMLS